MDAIMHVPTEMGASTADDTSTDGFGANSASVAHDTSSDDFGVNSQTAITTAAAVAIITARIEKSPCLCEGGGAEYTLIYNKQVRGTYLIAVSYEHDFYLMQHPLVTAAARCRAPRAPCRRMIRAAGQRLA